MWPFKNKAEIGKVEPDRPMSYHWFYSDWELAARCTSCDADAPREFCDDDAHECCRKCGAMGFTIGPFRSYQYVSTSLSAWPITRLGQWLAYADDDYPTGIFTKEYIDAIIKERKGS
jgi:hypothetical protein